MQINKIFNPAGNDRDVSSRSIWKANTTNLMQLNDVKYHWASQLFKQMRENFWIPEKVDLSQDINDYNNLTADERRGYDGFLSYLTFLDSIQTCNLPHIKSPVTSPEVNLCLTEQASQEGNHNKSYQVIIESIIPTEKRQGIYDLWREDKFLFERCKSIASLYQDYLDDSTEEKYFISLFADYCLEGIYFYAGFMLFYNLASRQLMPGTSDMIRYVNKDELSHVRLFQKIMEEAIQTFPHSTDQLYELMDKTVQQEIAWTNHIIGDTVLGITTISTEQYIKYLANTRLKAIGLKELYSGFNKSPYSHLERFADTKKEANVKGNFFETTVTSYSMATAINGWDF